MAVVVELDQVAVRPHPRVLLEVRVMEAAAVVANKAEGSRRKRVPADQLADARAGHGAVLERKRLDVHAEAAALEPAPPHGEVWAPQNETTDDVGPARDRLHRHGADVLTQPVVLPLVQDRTGRENRAQPAELELGLRRIARPGAELDIGRARAEDRHGL